MNFVKREVKKILIKENEIVCYALPDDYEN